MPRHVPASLAVSRAFPAVLDSPPPSCHYAIALAARHQHRLRNQCQRTTRGAADEPPPPSPSTSFPHRSIGTLDLWTSFDDPPLRSSPRHSTIAAPRHRHATSVRSEPLPSFPDLGTFPSPFRRLARPSDHVRRPSTAVLLPSLDDTDATPLSGRLTPF